MVRPMRKTRAPTQSQRAIGHIAALQSIATMFVMHAMVGRSTLQFKMPRLDAYTASTKPGVIQSVKVTSDLLKFCQISNREMRHGGKHFIGPHPSVWLC